MRWVEPLDQASSPLPRPVGVDQDERGERSLRKLHGSVPYLERPSGIVQRIKPLVRSMQQEKPGIGQMSRKDITVKWFRRGLPTQSCAAKARPSKTRSGSLRGPPGTDRAGRPTSPTWWFCWPARKLARSPVETSGPTAERSERASPRGTRSAATKSSSRGRLHSAPTRAGSSRLRNQWYSGHASTSAKSVAVSSTPSMSSSSSRCSSSS